MGNCEHKIRIDLYPPDARVGKTFSVVSCQLCHEIFNVIPNTNEEGLLKIIANELANISTHLGKIGPGWGKR